LFFRSHRVAQTFAESEIQLPVRRVLGVDIGGTGDDVALHFRETDGGDQGFAKFPPILRIANQHLPGLIVHPGTARAWRVLRHRLHKVGTITVLENPGAASMALIDHHTEIGAHRVDRHGCTGVELDFCALHLPVISRPDFESLQTIARGCLPTHAHHVAHTLAVAVPRNAATRYPVFRDAHGTNLHRLIESLVIHDRDLLPSLADGFSLRALRVHRTGNAESSAAFGAGWRGHCGKNQRCREKNRAYAVDVHQDASRR
jgi:hypothetical protein